MAENKQNFSKVYFLYTGGTIGMLHDDTKGLIPVKGNLTKLIDDIKIQHSLNIEYKIERTNPLIDSSNIRTSNWKAMLEKLYANYEKYDSFIIIHGTDTLAYTASALSFFLKDFDKTVIITGSQIPLFEFRNDAYRNILDSVIVSLFKIYGVLIVFGGQILRGNRSTKYSSTDFVAYHSPNSLAVGEIGVHININKNTLITPSPADRLLHKLPSIPSDWNLTDWIDNKIKIYTLTLLPDENSIILDAIIDLNPNAIILRTYGIGNAPVTDKKFMASIKRAIDNNILIVNSSQCIRGGVNMDYYDTGKLLKKVGVIGSNDMTLEATYTKLFFIFQLYGNKDLELVKTVFMTNLVGEISSEQFNISARGRLKGYFKKYQEL